MCSESDTQTPVTANEASVVEDTPGAFPFAAPAKLTPAFTHPVENTRFFDPFTCPERALGLARRRVTIITSGRIGLVGPEGYLWLAAGARPSEKGQTCLWQSRIAGLAPPASGVGAHLVEPVPPSGRCRFFSRHPP